MGKTYSTGYILSQHISQFFNACFLMFTRSQKEKLPATSFSYFSRNLIESPSGTPLSKNFPLSPQLVSSSGINVTSAIARVLYSEKSGFKTVPVQYARRARYSHFLTRSSPTPYLGKLQLPFLWCFGYSVHWMAILSLPFVIAIALK